MKERLSKLVTWALSRQGYHDIGAAAGAVAALYKALQAAGVL